MKANIKCGGNERKFSVTADAVAVEIKYVNRKMVLW